MEGRGDIFIVLFVFHKLHPSDINLWDTGLKFWDVMGNISQRFLIIVVCRKGKFYHHVINNTQKDWDIFDSNKYASWDDHTK